jgi:hypothetical protein
MTDALRVMHIGGLLRQAIKLVRGCNITQTDDEFVMDITSVIGWFKVREKFKLNGEVSTNRRRDWRGGARLLYTGAVCFFPRVTIPFVCFFVFGELVVRRSLYAVSLTHHPQNQKHTTKQPQNKGGTRGTLKAVAPDRLQLRLEFDDPHGGVNVDEFHMPTNDELHVTTVITTTAGETAKFTQVYTRRE